MKIKQLLWRCTCKNIKNLIRYNLTILKNDDTIKTSKFPNELKHADVTPAHKKDDTTKKTNCRPINILPSVSKNFGNMFNQILAYIEKYLSPYLGFHKHYNTQNCLIVMIEKWKKALDKKRKCRGCAN